MTVLRMDADNLVALEFPICVDFKRVKMTVRVKGQNWLLVHKTTPSNLLYTCTTQYYL